MFLPDAVLDHVREVTEEPDLSGTKYELVRPLGRGGMGVVYAARDRDLDREVALKVIDIVEHEPKILARLEHPGIVPVHDVGTLPDGRVFYAMKLVRDERLDRWKGDRTSALRLFQKICEAVAFAHAQGVIHRDLKPENVMIGAFGEALVMDWGVAIETGRTHAIAGGTKGFMSPEQARGEEFDERTDIYALGAILRALVPDQPKALEAIVRKAMAEKASDRYATAMLLSDDIERFLQGHAVSAHEGSFVEGAIRFASRHRVLLSLLAVYLLVRVILAFVSR